MRETAQQATTDAEVRRIIHQINTITRKYRTKKGIDVPSGPAAQAQQADPAFRIRPHTEYLDGVISQAVTDVENGHNRFIAVSTPPRVGKSTLISHYTPVWLLRKHPEWKIVMTSYDNSLAVSWGRAVRHTLEEHSTAFNVSLASDVKAAGEWQTLDGGGMLARSYRSGITGRGAKVLIIDDPVKDFVEAHSPNARDALWNWWLSTAYTRLEAPYLVLVVMTRWHEDDFIGRLKSTEYDGDPADWQIVKLPALAEEGDQIGRDPGEPLYSPLLDESEEDAVDRWEKVRAAVGTYTFSAMYQQSPAPSAGEIFNAQWWRYWTSNPANVSDDGKVIYVNPHDLGARGHWLDSWDMSFKGDDSSDYVVGQRWVRVGATRYLIGQFRKRIGFTQQIEQMKSWAEPSSLRGTGKYVHMRVVEEKANGHAVIETLQDQISGIVAENPTDPKPARARAVSPDVEAGNVRLPYPGDPGNEWVPELLSELRNFPHDAHDDQVDTLTQALRRLRTSGTGRVAKPSGSVTIDRVAAARSVTNGARRSSPRGIGRR